MEQQSGKTPETTSRSGMPAAAGALIITSGALGIIGIPFLIAFGVFGREIARDALTSIGFMQTVMPLQIIGFFSVPLFIVSVVAIIGGIYAVQRKNWGLALAGLRNLTCTIQPQTQTSKHRAAPQIRAAPVAR